MQYFAKTMAGLGFIKPFPSPGYTVWENWREYYLDVCEAFMWTEEEVKRYLPGKLCGWALEALNYLPHEFWKSDQKKHRAWTLQETLYFFDLSLSNFPTMYEDAFDRYLIEKEKYEKTVLQCEIERPVFQSDVVDRKKLESKEVTQKIETKVEKVSADAIVKPVMTRKPANIHSTKCSSDIKAVDFGQNAVLDEKPKVGNERQRSTPWWTDSLCVVETAADSNYIGGSQHCDSNGEIEDQKENAVDDNRQNENEDSNIGGSGDTIQEGETVFGASHQQLAPAFFKMLENRRVDAKIAVADESVTDDAFENSTAEDLMMTNATVDGQDESAVGSRDVASGLVQMKTEEPDYSEGKTLLERGNEITAGRIQESCLDIGEQNWPLGRERKKNSPLNAEPQLLHFASDGILQSEQGVQSAIEQSLMVVQSKVSSAEEVNFGESSNSELECEVLHFQKGKFHDDKFLSLSKASDLHLKFPIVGEVACAFDIEEDVVAKHLESSYPKQHNEREQSSYFEVKKAIGNDQKHLLMCLSGREEIVQCRRELSCSSSTNLLRANDDHRSAELDYPELCKLLFGKQRVSRKEKWNKLKLEYQSNRLVWRKRKKRLKNETGGGHPFKHQRNKEELSKDAKLRW